MIKFSWFITDKCNLKCDYCYFYNNNFGKLVPKNNFKILSHIRNIKYDFWLTLLGGEPLLYKNINIIIKTILNNPHCKRLEIFTNTTRNFVHNDPRIFLFCSAHLSQISYSQFLNNIEYFKKTFTHTKLHVCIPLIDEKLQETTKIINYCRVTKIPFHTQIIVNEHGCNNLNENTQTITDKDIFNFCGNIVTLNEIIKNKISFKGWTCFMEHFQIAPYGIFDSCSKQIYSFADFSYLPQKIQRICTKETCLDNGDFLFYNTKVFNDKFFIIHHD